MFENRSKEEEIFPLTTPEIAEAQKADSKFKHYFKCNAVLVIGHGIVAGNISCKMLRFAKSPIADVRFDLKSKPDLRISRDLRSK